VGARRDRPAEANVSIGPEGPLLESRGWTLDHINGSHDVDSQPDTHHPITVPVHGNRDLRAETHRSILNEAGLTDDDLEWPSSFSMTNP